MRTITIQSVAAAHEVASTIAGVSEALVLVDAEISASVQVRPDGEFTEIRLRGDFESTANVMIRRPHVDYHRGLTGSTVTWGSSDSTSVGRGNAVATARLLAFAADVAARLDEWAEAGQLPYLAPEPEFAKGDVVDVSITRAGGANEPVVGMLRCVVVNVGGEYDARLLDPSEVESAEDVFEAAGGDVEVADLRETVDGVEVYLLRNLQPEQLTLVSKAAA